MKRILSFLILLILFSCNKVVRSNLNANDWYIIEIKSIDNSDCRVPQVAFLTGVNEVKQFLNSSLNIYNATGLPDVNYAPGNRLTVKIKKPEAADAIVCTTMGPSYMQVVITEVK